MKETKVATMDSEMNFKDIGRELEKCNGDKKKVNDVFISRGIPISFEDQKFINTEYKHNWKKENNIKLKNMSFKRCKIELIYEQNINSMENCKFICSILQGEADDFLEKFFYIDNYDKLKAYFIENNMQETAYIGSTPDGKHAYVLFRYTINGAGVNICKRVEQLKNGIGFCKLGDGTQVCLDYNKSLSFAIEDQYEKNKDDVLDMLLNNKEGINPDFIYANSSTQYVYCRCCNGIKDHHSFRVLPLNVNGKNCNQCYTAADGRYNSPYSESLKKNYPEIAERLVSDKDGNKLDTSKIRKKSHLECIFKCIGCGKKITKTIEKAVESGILCECCRDGILTPEKYVANVLRQMNIKYEHRWGKKKGQLLHLKNIDENYVQKFFDINKEELRKRIERYTKKYVNEFNIEFHKLAGKKEYDFFIRKTSINKDIYIFIEANGEQHYKEKKGRSRTLDEEVLNDMLKKALIEENFKDKDIIYIELDMRKSTKDFLENSVKMKLKEVFDVSKVNFEKAYNKSLKSEVVETWNLRKKGYTAKEIAKILNCDLSTVFYRVKKGRECGVLNYKKNWHKDYNSGNIKVEVKIPSSRLPNQKIELVKSKIKDVKNCIIIEKGNEIVLVFESKKSCYDFLKISIKPFDILIKNKVVDCEKFKKATHNQCKSYENIELLNGCEIIQREDKLYGKKKS